MNNLEKEFIPYGQALALKELGFDRPCLGYFDPLYKQLVVWEKESTNSYSNWVSAPLYQQAFRWLYQNLEIKGSVPIDTKSQVMFLKELIEKLKLNK